MAYLDSLFSLQGKGALVVGGSRGIGKGIAAALAAAGASLVVASRTAEQCTNAALDIHHATGSRVCGIPADITTTAGVRALVDAAIQQLSHIDILVNCAGINIREPALDYTEESWDKVVDAQLKGPFFTTQAVARHMVAQGIPGRIINIASLNAVKIVRPHIPAYVAAKTGIMQLTKALAFELAPQNIVVNCLAPGWFITDLNRSLFDDPTQSAQILGPIPMGRAGDTTKDFNGIAIYLASQACSYMTGQMLCVDGGLSCV